MRINIGHVRQIGGGELSDRELHALAEDVDHKQLRRMLIGHRDTVEPRAQIAAQLLALESGPSANVDSEDRGAVLVRYKDTPKGRKKLGQIIERARSIAAQGGGVALPAQQSRTSYLIVFSYPRSAGVGWAWPIAGATAGFSVGGPIGAVIGGMIGLVLT